MSCQPVMHALSSSPETTASGGFSMSLHMILFVVIGFSLLLTACAVGPQGYWRAPDRADLNQQKDNIECQAMAAQAATGAGSWSSDPAIRAAIFQNAKDQYYAQCLQSRGYQWVTPR